MAEAGGAHNMIKITEQVVKCDVICTNPRSHISASLVMEEAGGAHLKSGRLFSWSSHSDPKISCMSPFVGLLMNRPVLTSSVNRSWTKERKERKHKKD